MEETESVETSTPTAPAPEAPAPAPQPAAEPAAEAPQQAPEPVPAPAHDPEALAALAERAAAQRLPAAEEEKAVQLVCAALLAGAEDIAPLLPKLGWTASSRGVAAAWPDLKAAARTAFLKTICADENEATRRIRLSVARSLFKVPDVPACTKLIVGVAKEIRDKKTGEIPQREAQNFAAVMIGKGKPWIAQLAIADLKPADAAALVQCALTAAFSTGGPPVTPLGVLRWAAEAGQLADLSEATLATITKGVARWSPKWADALRNEIPSAPEPILAALKTAQPELSPEASAETSSEASGESLAGDATVDDSDAHDAEDDGLPAELKEGSAEGEAPKQRPVYVSKTVPPKDQRPQQQQTQPSQSPQQSQPREGRGPSPKSAQFNANDALRQVESHIVWLKHELQGAEKKLRSRDDERRRKPDVPVIEGEPTPEELARLNVQLEARIGELQARIDDLTADAEARATSAGAFSGETPAPDAQLRTLLGLKLAEHFADFAALEQEDRDIVIPHHYRTVLAEVFEVLKAEGIPLTPPPPAAP